MDSMTQDRNNSIVRVEIFDQAFNLRGDPNHNLKLAEYVDSKMRSFAEKYIVDNFQLAVLAALNIAHECHRLKTKLDGEERGASGEEEAAEHLSEEDKERIGGRRQR